MECIFKVDVDVFVYCINGSIVFVIILKIGVHSAKFLNEKDYSKVAAAVQRYNIQHPVVNDAESSVWEALGIKCWPTILILGKY